MSTNKRNALDQFKLFYEEITTVKPVRPRLRRVRQTANANS
ncbi:MAG: hypothetical protein ABSD10_03870 [Candidatus Saccharimonadales bacterium]